MKQVPWMLYNLHAWVWKKRHLFEVFTTPTLNQFPRMAHIYINQASIFHLQLLSRYLKREHIMPVLASLHWLPIWYRILYMILLFVFKAQHGLARSYITELLFPYRTARPLRSTDQGLLTIPQSRWKLFGDRAFSEAEPRLWNGLPESIRIEEPLHSYKRRLKTHFCSLA